MSGAGELSGRFIVVGVSGGIAAYKAVEVCRQLVDAGAHVAPIMTPDAERFIGKTTLSALCSEPVHTSLWDDSSPIPHTRLGQRADLIIVAPATARVIAAYAAGMSDDLLTATLIATVAPVVVCPAMHTEMWEHAAVQHNISTLRSRGVHIVDPEDGRLAGGDIGRGRLASAESIVAEVRRVLAPSASNLAGRHVVVSAGGTREPIDAVRVIANRSSGKQGHAIAVEAARRGAKVTLVTTANFAPAAGVGVVSVETAAEMKSAIDAAAASADVVIMTAAVADFRPVPVAEGKWKKEDGAPPIVLEPTPDILAGLGAAKRPGQVLVGFAAETSNLVENAKGKLVRKNLDIVVANDVSQPKVGFGHDTNAVTIVTKTGISNVPLADKHTVAAHVLDSVEQSLHPVSTDRKQEHP
ncbi:MAG: bifunctional phosphopantothenoylcysteine decarboxylase/phosphopantothenate--cysteine ligase CoaBC [Ilumatobacteraceae bacterium]|jgi:phosphopantothenoylcysteine decarboxylase/phosphopantothenate--cysteine ligase